MKKNLLFTLLFTGNPPCGANQSGMKSLLFTLLFAMIAVVGVAQQPSIIEKVLMKSVEEKVSSMREVIGFDDEKACQLRQMELNFLLEVNKVEHCKMCNKKKRIEKLEKKRDYELQSILERDEYIKYKSLEDNLLNKDNRLWSGK